MDSGMRSVSRKLWTPSSHELSNVETPALVLNYDQMQKNCEKVLSLAKRYNINLRPHVKTLSSVDAALLMTGGKRRRIAVATISEAEFFARAGFDDILYTKLVEPSVLARCEKLSRQLDEFHVMIDSLEHVSLLSDYKRPSRSWSVFVKVNCGKGRAGVDYNDPLLRRVVEEVKENMQFAGLYVYCGNSYEVSKAQRAESVDDTIRKLLYAVDSLKRAGHDVPSYGIGSTPTASEDRESMSSINELHPGNYVVYDEQQAKLGSCTHDQIAIVVATRVIGKYPNRDQMIVDCGFSKISRQKDPDKEEFGSILGYPNLRLTSLSQESGVIKAAEGRINFEDFPIGSILYIRPWHACAAALLHSHYQVISNGKLMVTWKRSSCPE